MEGSNLVNWYCITYRKGVVHRTEIEILLLVAKGFNSTQYQSPPFCWGDSLQSQILKRGGVGVGGIRKKMSAWGVLTSPCHRYLPWGWRWERVGLAMFLVKKDCKMKCGFERSIFKCQSWPVLAKQPINVWFCDILVLLNHLNSVTRT